MNSSLIQLSPHQHGTSAAEMEVKATETKLFLVMGCILLLVQPPEIRHITGNEEIKTSKPSHSAEVR